MAHVTLSRIDICKSVLQLLLLRAAPASCVLRVISRAFLLLEHLAGTFDLSRRASGATATAGA